jgi:hypothetical protein
VTRTADPPRLALKRCKGCTGTGSAFATRSGYGEGLRSGTEKAQGLAGAVSAYVVQPPVRRTHWRADDEGWSASGNGGLPEVADGTPEDENGVPGPAYLTQPRSGRLGKEGRPTHFTGVRAEHVPGWRYPLRAQICALKDELRSLVNDIATWSRRASGGGAPETKMGADWALRWHWERWRTLTARLRWLRSEIPVSAVTGEDLSDY